AAQPDRAREARSRHGGTAARRVSGRRAQRAGSSGLKPSPFARDRSIPPWSRRRLASLSGSERTFNTKDTRFTGAAVLRMPREYRIDKSGTLVYSNY
ncbi:MAG: hypothetical protein KKC85_21410, partial [Gammaproteobacteria bacterium]|nr:hypothetical protein [Gammaproteobacteria bacterium]